VAHVQVRQQHTTQCHVSQPMVTCSSTQSRAGASAAHHTAPRQPAHGHLQQHKRSNSTHCISPRWWPMCRCVSSTPHSATSASPWSSAAAQAQQQHPLHQPKVVAHV
jgi:hypothetical protein